MSHNALPSDKLQEIISRIVETAHPSRIILFGSFARGEMRPDSDIDLLVIKGGMFNYYHLLGDIYKSLRGVGQAVDVVLATPEQVEQYRNAHCLVIAPALKEGKEVYHD